jgi:hypothetical protein
MPTPAFNSAGTNVGARVEFNSGTFDFGSNQLVNVNNLKIDLKWDSKLMYVLNSIKIAFNARGNESVQVTGDVLSWSPELDSVLYGSSTSGSPSGIYALDGQPTLINPWLTVNDSNGKQIQYQFTNALFTADSVTFNQEDYGKWSFTLMASDLNIVYTQ